MTNSYIPLSSKEGEEFTQDGTVDIKGRPVLASKTGKWKACSFLLCYEAFENMAYLGISSNLVVYLTTQLFENTVSAVRNVNIWSGTVWLTPILGAYIADAYAGRFWTFSVSALIYIMGMILMTVAASTSRIALFYSALYIITIGAGGTKPNITSFAADQFDDFNPCEKELKSSFFNWWIFSSYFGLLAATLGLVYIQENVGWGLGYGIPTVGLSISIVTFYLGTPNYRHKVRNTRSPIKNLILVPIAAIANRKLVLPNNFSELHELEPHHYISGQRRMLHTSAFRFLDRAAIKDIDGGCSKQLFTLTQVERTKQVFAMILIWLTTLIPVAVTTQLGTLQGTTLDRRIGSKFEFPSASLGTFGILEMIVCIPLYDRYFVPLMELWTGNPRGITLLQRLGTGFVIQAISILFAYLVEVKRMRVIKEHWTTMSDEDTLPMSIFWLLPQCTILGISDVFSIIAKLEFFYDHSPEDMKSLGVAFYFCSLGVGNLLSGLLVTTVDKITGRNGKMSWIGKDLNDSRLDYCYILFLMLAILNLGAFNWISNKYSYKKEAIELVTEGT